MASTLLRRPIAALALLLALAALRPVSVWADGISVSGTATVHAKPTVVEIVGIVAVDAELASDARVKFFDARKKAVDTIQALHEPDPTFKLSGPTIKQGLDPVSQNQMQQGVAQVSPKQRVQIYEEVLLVMSGVDKLESDKLVEKVLKIIDVLHEAGMGVGEMTPRSAYEWRMRGENFGDNGAMLMAKVPERAVFEGQAYEQAMADARAKAQRIADLSGVHLGRVIEVVDQSAAQNPEMTGPQNQNAAANKLGEIPITVQLSVRFEMVPK